MRLECSCRGDLALRHRACAEKWSEVKGDRRCDVCRSVVENLPEPPPRPPRSTEEGNQAATAAHHLEGVPPHLLPFVFGPGVGNVGGNGAFDPVVSSDGRVVSPFWAAVAAERGSGAGVAAHLLHPVPPLSSADAAFDFLRVAWIGTIVSLLWLVSFLGFCGFRFFFFLEGRLVLVLDSLPPPLTPPPLSTKKINSKKKKKKKTGHAPPRVLRLRGDRRGHLHGRGARDGGGAGGGPEEGAGGRGRGGRGGAGRRRR